MGEEAKQATLAPPAVVALKEEATLSGPSRVQMERTVSMDIREQREDLKEAAEQSLNVIMDLDLDGNIRWVSPSWKDIIGTPPDSVRGKPIADILVGDNTTFANSVESMKKDNSRSQIIRFSARMGPLSVLRPKCSSPPESEQGSLLDLPTEGEDEHILNLEAQGIMVYDRTSGGESHVSYWSLK
jgi:serine/threonine-protein kinase RIM15